MSYNVFLAIIPIIFWWVALQVKPYWAKFLFGFGWLIFLPNTIYILTDIIHLFIDIERVGFYYKAALIFLHAVLMGIGIITFIYALYPFEKLIAKKKKYRQILPLFLFIFNFLISFGVVLGRVQRINSWDLIINPQSVAQASIQILQSTPLILFIISFGFLSNIIYFGLRKIIISKI